MSISIYIIKNAKVAIVPDRIVNVIITFVYKWLRKEFFRISIHIVRNTKILNLPDHKSFLNVKYFKEEFFRTRKYSFLIVL